MVTGAAESGLLRAEHHAALREAFTHLPPDARQLIALLIQDPPVPYAEISARLGIPVGSIGPNRGRCLDKLRRYPAIAALINAGTRNAGADIDVQPQRRTNRQVSAACHTTCVRAREAPPKDRDKMPPVSPAEGSSPSLAETASYRIRAMSQCVTVVPTSTR